MANKNLPEKKLEGIITIDDNGMYNLEMMADYLALPELLAVASLVGQAVMYKFKEEGDKLKKDSTGLVKYFESSIVAWYYIVMEEFDKAYANKKV